MQNHGRENNSVATHCTQVCGGNSFARSCSKICLVKVHPEGETHKKSKMYTVIDEHSNRSLTHLEFFNLFDHHGPPSSYSLRTCAGVMEMVGRRTHGYRIESMDGRVSLSLPTLIECAEVPDNHLEIPTSDAARHHKHLASIRTFLSWIPKPPFYCSWAATLSMHTRFTTSSLALATHSEVSHRLGDSGRCVPGSQT